ncbi:MAG: PolC-type DNA polymerase III [Clostridia bacterium]|nr:PolC-type DNA polymerase III [Clostridia bacterium]
MKLHELFNESLICGNFKDVFENCTIENVNINKETRKIDLCLTCNSIIPKSVIIEVAADIKKEYNLKIVKISTSYPKELFNEEYYMEILYFTEKKYPHLYWFLEGSRMKIGESSIDIVLKDNGIDILKYNGMDNIISSLIEEEFGLSYKINFIGKARPKETEESKLKKEQEEREFIKKALEQSAQRQQTEAPKPQKTQEAPKQQYQRKIEYKEYKIIDLNAETGRVKIKGEIFFTERRDFNNSQKGSVTFYVTDQESSVICKVIDKKENLDEFEAEFKKGSYVYVCGETMYDKYIREFVIDVKIRDVEKTSKTTKTDDATVKRVELHLHTNMSAIDGINKIEDYMSLAKSYGHPAIAVTDHGVVQAFPDAYAAAKKNEIKLVYGVEGYLCESKEDIKNSHHIIILVKNQVGLKNLYKLVSMAHIDYYHRNPKTPREELIKHREGLIIGSACEAGELYRAILDGKSHEELLKIADFYDYLEIQPLGNNQYLVDNGRVAGRDGLIEINKKIIELGDELGKKVVATGDVHFLNQQGGLYRAILMAGKKFKDAANQPPLWYRTTNEMLAEFDYLDADRAYEVVVENPNYIVSLVDDNFEPVPHEKHPPVIEGAAEEIEEKTYKRAYEIYGDPLPEIVKARIEKELNSIINNGFSVMYIIAEKLVTKSLSDGYLVGSRGSVGSSFVAYLSGITEVNSLCPHYICQNCHHSIFIDDGSYSSGCDMEDMNCPKCGTLMKKDGHDIPFETFLGFDGDKEPDIDLNFSGDYQPVAHKYVEELFGEGHVFRAGTIGTIADKTAYGYVKNFFDEQGRMLNNAEMQRLSIACTGAKATTGQHPGGIIIVPKSNEVYDFTPIQHPANDKSSGIITTHFDYHKLHDTLLKLDILGHDDPTVLRMLKDITGLDPVTISLEDKETMSLFTSPEALGVTAEDIGAKTGTFGVPEFGTKFTRQMLEDTKPTTFAELVRISGLSHGTDVWLNNAQDIVLQGIAPFKETICTRDDIMTYLIHKDLPPKRAFTIMEQVRKGKGLKDIDIEEMKEHNVPQWYIDSCNKIKYMFPKAHAVAYVTMGFRVAYYKVHYPLEYYCAYYTVRADDFDYSIMAKGRDKVKDIMRNYDSNPNLTAKEKSIYTILEIVNEFYARGYDFLPIDLYKSDASKFVREGDKIRPPFTSLKGLGLSVAESIVEAREKEEFFTKEDFAARTKAGSSIIDMLAEHGCFKDMPDSSQIDLFNLI